MGNFDLASVGNGDALLWIAQKCEIFRLVEVRSRCYLAAAFEVTPMKTLLINALACAALILPFSQVQAAGAGKSFGGFKPKQTFSFKVTSVASVKTVGASASKAPIPAGIPKFKLKQTVKFTIGAKGQLTGPGFSIPFLKSGSSAGGNGYTNVVAGSRESPIVGLVIKNQGTVNTGAPASASIIFSKYTVKGTTVTTNAVTYYFE